MIKHCELENPAESKNEVSEPRTTTQAKKEKDEIQITISLECDERLQKALHRINLDFEFGRVTRKHLAVYIINKALARFSNEDLQEVRQSTLTDQALFEKVVRNFRETGVMPAEIREFLWKSSSLTQGPKKTKKASQANDISGIHTKSEAA